MFGQLFEYAIMGLKHWWSQVTCKHDYVIEHYDQGLSLERCTKCYKINKLGR